MEAIATCHWLMEPLGTVLLAHPQNLRWLVHRHKTDRVEAQVLANLFGIDRLPLANRPSDE